MDAPRTTLWSAPVVATYVILGAILLSNRLFAVLHAESSATVAFGSFFIAGLHFLSTARSRPPDARLLLVHFAMLGIPLLFLTASQVVYRNCAYWSGLYLYVVFALPSVAFGLAVGAAVNAWVRRLPRLVFVLIGLAVAVAGTLFDIGFHPQFYTLNHVYGGVLGPVYEQALYIRPGILAFRAQTLLWSVLLLCLASVRGPAIVGLFAQARVRRTAVAVCSLLIGGIYLAGPRLGIVASYRHIESELGGYLQTEHFDIYFHPEALDVGDRDQLALDHEYRYAKLRAELGVEPARRIKSYIYPTVDLKLRLTGAGLTDVSPVWLSVPQMHVLQASYSETFGHELVHVFSREFGLPILNASWLAGMVEGLAVALEPPDGRPSVREQVSVAARRRNTADVGLGSSMAADLVRMMSPAAFWTSRGSVSYATAGSFVRYLIDAYGIGLLRKAYPRGDFRAAYGKSLRELATEWEAHVASLPVVSTSADDLVMRRFTVPSLFEIDCPHYRPPYVTRYRRAADRLAMRDTLGALADLDAALAEQPRYAPALTVWSGMKLAQGEPNPVLEAVSDMPDSLYHPLLHVYHGDALAIQGDSVSALRQYRAALQRLPTDARDVRMAVLVRVLGEGRPYVARAFHPGNVASRDADADPATRYALAYRLAVEDEWEAAYAMLPAEEFSGEMLLNRAEIAFMERMRKAWLGRFSIRTGALSTARAHLEAARRDAQRVGDFAHAAELGDAIRRCEWQESGPNTTLLRH